MAGVVVTVRWGETILVSRLLTAGDAAIGGEGEGLCPLPAEVLGAPRVTVARVTTGGAWALVPEGAVGFHERPSALPAPLLGPTEVLLGAAETVSFTTGAFLVTVGASSAEEIPWRGRVRVRGALVPGACAALAAAAHAAVLLVSSQSASAAAFEPDPAIEDLSRYLASADARTLANEDVVASHEGVSRAKYVDGRDGNGAEGGGARARGSEGKTGSQEQREKRQTRYSVAGAEKKNQALSREDALADARSFGLAGILAADASRAPFVSFGEVAAKGMDAMGARGDLWGSSVAETFGTGGLTLSGTGEGGGGRYQGIGIGDLGYGHTDGSGDFTGGRGSGLLQTLPWGGSWVDGCYRCRRSVPLKLGIDFGAPMLRSLRRDSASPDAGAFLAAARRAERSLRACYKAKVTGDPDEDVKNNPSGTVVTSLAIDETGRVLTAGNVSSSLGAPQMVLCVMTALRAVTYPSRPGLGSVGAEIAVRYRLTVGSR